LHLVVEASDKAALSAGMRSLVIRIARAVNELVGRKGRLWSDRWHGRELESPREVRNAFVYVLANFRKHTTSRLAAGVDAFSSAAKFDGWRDFGTGKELPRAGPPFHGALERWVIVSKAKTWLAREGWRLRGLVDVGEAPGGA
jgi:hypothetical protein